MEFQDHLRSDPGSAFPSQPPAEFDRSSGKTAGGPADPYCSVWNHCKRSFATDARLGLEGLTSGYNSASPRCFTGGVVGKYGHPCDKEDSQEEESILDSVELLDVEAGVQDDESWYEPSHSCYKSPPCLAQQSVLLLPGYIRPQRRLVIAEVSPLSGGADTSWIIPVLRPRLLVAP